jgi:TonB family protein
LLLDERLLERSAEEGIVRCTECVTERLTHAQYCECCGHKVSFQERNTASVARCESCGGPSADGALCGACEEAFGAILGGGRTSMPAARTSSDEIVDAPAAVPAEEDAHTAAEQATADAPQAEAARAEAEQLEAARAEAARKAQEAKADAARIEAEQAEAARAEAARIEAERAEAEKLEMARLEAERADAEREEAEKAEAARIEAAKAEADRAEAARKTAASVIADRAAAAAKREQENLARGPRPVAAAAPAEVPSGSRKKGLLLTVAAVAIAGIVGVAQRDMLLGLHGPAPRSSEGETAELVTSSDAGGRAAKTPPRRKSVDESSRSALPVRPSPASPAQPRATQTPVKSVNASAIAAAPIAAEAAAVVPTALVAVMAPEPAASERPATTPAAAPAGKFFEPNDVDVAPQVAKRIEPQVPANLKGRPLNDVVIVRVLVSQAGDPSHVSLLRRSKHGRPLDEAVVAAVTQWRFSPAKRRGEAVSSWISVGVPLTQDN